MASSSVLSAAASASAASACRHLERDVCVQQPAGLPARRAVRMSWSAGQPLLGRPRSQPFHSRSAQRVALRVTAKAVEHGAGASDIKTEAPGNTRLVETVVEGTVAKRPSRISGLPFAGVTSSVQESHAPSSSKGESGFPLLWIGLGVGVTLIFSTVANWGKNRAQRAAMDQMMKSMSSPGSNPFGSAAGSSSPFSSTSTIDTTASPSSIPVPNVEAPKSERKKSSFTDVGQEVVQQVMGGAGESRGRGPTTNGQATEGSGITMDMLEKMLGEPMIQNMLLQYLPENMRDPGTLKWVLQNPIYKKQLEDVLQSINKDGAKDPRIANMFNNFDLNSDEMKQQFDQIGMTPEQVVTTIMADPEMATAFQNPKFQAAILDCSTNPMNMLKYQNDPEVMEFFDKMQRLFPNMGRV